jgi:hypothetical protein
MPPLRHLVFFKFFASSTAEQQNAVRTALNELPSVIPNILYYNVFSHARDLHPGYVSKSKGYTMVIDSIFADAKALSVYGPHPAHQGVIAKYINPIREDNLVVDFTLPETFNVDAWAQLQRPPHVRHLVMFRMKDEFKGESRTVSGSLEQLQATIPVILSTLSGEQRLSELYDGYNDRSKGIVNVADLVLKDGAALDAYDHHPDHDKFVKDNIHKLDEILTFDYQP